MARIPRRRPSTEPGALRPWKRRKPLVVPDTPDDQAAGTGGRRLRAMDLLPNAFTTAALFSGFYAIVQAMSGQFNTAVYAIFAAMVLDSLDGRVARMTNTQSEFGAEYD